MEKLPIALAAGVPSAVVATRLDDGRHPDLVAPGQTAATGRTNLKIAVIRRHKYCHAA
jgi:hypothetical protein